MAKPAPFTPSIFGNQGQLPSLGANPFNTGQTYNTANTVNAANATTRALPSLAQARVPILPPQGGHITKIGPPTNDPTNPPVTPPNQSANPNPPYAVTIDRRGFGPGYGYGGGALDDIFSKLPEAWRAELSTFPTEGVRDYLELLKAAQDGMRQWGKEPLIKIDGQIMTAGLAAQYVRDRMREVKGTLDKAKQQQNAAAEKAPLPNQMRVSPFIANSGRK